MNDELRLDILAELIADDTGTWPGLLAINATLRWLVDHPKALEGMQEGQTP